MINLSQPMKKIKNKLNSGFSIIETVAAVFVFSIIAPSLLLVVSLLVKSSYFVSSYYLNELLFRSYLERELISGRVFKTQGREDNIVKSNELLNIRVTTSKTPHPRIFLQTIENKDNLHTNKISMYRLKK